MTEEFDKDLLERATRSRLARLGQRPVDTTAAERRLRAAMERGQTTRLRLRLPSWPAWGGMAAAVALMVTLVVVLNGMGSPAVAAPSAMVRFHEDVLAGRAPSIPVSDIQEARQAIRARWPDAPSLPSLPDGSIHGCCLGEIEQRRVVCILMRQDDLPVTVVVARAEDLQSAKGPSVARNGHRYFLHSSRDLNMVMTRDQGRWFCFMGELPDAELIELAEDVVF